MATCKDCLHSFVCWKSMQVEKDNLPCSDFADRSKYVVREKGEWLLDGRCSNCLENPLTTHKNFCPNCGADMRTEEQNRARGDNG